MGPGEQELIKAEKEIWGREQCIKAAPPAAARGGTGLAGGRNRRKPNSSMGSWCHESRGKLRAQSETCGYRCDC